MIAIIYMYIAIAMLQIDASLKYTKNMQREGSIPVADLGFPEGGPCYTLACEILEATPTFG